MHPRSALPALALALATACDSTTTGPNRVRPDAVAPSFQSEGVPSETDCVGFLSGTFQNVVVPPGATCFLVRSTVTGNVKALEGARLTTSANEIAGNIEIEKAGFANLVFDVVGGNVIMVDGIAVDEAPPSDYRVNRLTLTQGNLYVIKNRGDVSIRFNRLLKGNMKIEDNVVVTFLAVTNNEVAQNLQVFKNTGPGSKTVRANVAGESIQCWENAPPFFAELNSAPKLEGQCAVPPPAE